MKRILGIFKQRWFLSLLGILALALVIWFIGPLIAIAGFEPLASVLARVMVILLVFAALQLAVSAGIFAGALWARVLGVVGAGLNVMAQFAFMSVYPAWSWFIIAVNGLVIYGLTVHGDEVSEW